MAEIEEGDLASRGAFEAPGKLGREFDKLAASIYKVLDAAKATEQAIKAANTTSKVAKETDNLRKAQKQLTAEQEKAAKIAKVLWLSENEVAESLKRAGDQGKKTGSIISELDRQQHAAANSAAQFSKAEGDAAKQAGNAQKAYKAESGTLQELVQKKQQLKNANAAQLKDQKEDANLLKTGIITRAEYNQRMTESQAVIAKNNVSIQSLNGQIKSHILLTGQMAGPYKQLNIQLDSARAKLKDMGAASGVASRAFRDQQKVVDDLDKKIKAIDASAGQFQRNVGNYPGTFGAATMAVTRLVAAFGLVTGVQLFANMVKDAVATITDFEYKNSTLQAVLGETKRGIKDLTDQQRLYGETTLYSARQVADLQIIYSKLGLTTMQIKNATAATLDLATATGEDLAKSADVVGTVLSAFGIDASETTRIVDVMTASFNKTSLGVSNFFEAIKYVAPIAKANNISLEETTAMLGTLADAGIRGSMAGTSLRKIFSSLDKGTGTLSEKFKSLAAKGYDSADAMDDVGRTAYAALTVLVNQADKTDELNNSLQNVNGTAKETAAIMADNLKGDADKARNAFEALAITYEEDLVPALRSAVQSFTGFIYLLREIPGFIKDNRVLIYALIVAIIGLRFNTIRATLANLAYELSFKRLIIQQRLAALSTRALTAALLANPIGAVIVAVAALAVAVTIYDKVSRRAEEVEARRNKLNKELASTTKIVTKAQQDLNISSEKWLKMSEEQRKSHAEQIQAMVNLARARIVEMKAQKAQLGERAKELTLWQNLKNGAIFYFDKTGAAANASEDSMNNSKEATEGVDDAITKLEGEVDGLTHLLDDNTEALDNNKKKQKELTDEQKKAAEKARKAAIEARQAQIELEKFRLEQSIKINEEIQDNENQSANTRLAALRQLEEDRRNVIEIERQKALLEEEKDGNKNKATLKLIEEKYQAALTALVKKGNEDRRAINQQDIDKTIEQNKYNFQAQSERILAERERASAEAVAVIQAEVIAGKKTREQGDEEILRTQQKFDKELLELSIETYEQMFANERFIYFEARKKAIEESTLDQVDKDAALLVLSKESAAEQAEIAKMLAELRMRLQQLLYDSQTDKFAKEIKALKKVQMAYESFSSAVGNLFSSLSARRLSDIDIQEKREQEAFDAQIAAVGDNDKAKERIEKKAAARRKQLERDRITEQRRAAKIEKVQAMVSAAIAGSLAVLNALSTVKPYPAAVVAAISAGVLAGVQIAAIAAAPLPQYAEGVAMGVHPGGPALVGERGTERMTTPSGHVSYTPSKPTIMNVPRGTQVDTAEETMRDLAFGGLMRGINSDRRADSSTRELVSEMRAVKQAVRDSKPESLNLVHRAGVIMEAHRVRDGIIDMVRSRAMGNWRKK
jgi:hypothetical protein